LLRFAGAALFWALVPGDFLLVRPRFGGTGPFGLLTPSRWLRALTVARLFEIAPALMRLFFGAAHRAARGCSAGESRLRRLAEGVGAAEGRARAGTPKSADLPVSRFGARLPGPWSKTATASGGGVLDATLHPLPLTDRMWQASPARTPPFSAAWVRLPGVFGWVGFADGWGLCAPWPGLRTEGRQGVFARGEAGRGAAGHERAPVATELSL